MRPNEIDEEEEFRGPSKSHLKRVQLDLQSLGRDMTRMGDETLAKIGLPEDVLVEIIEFRRMKSFGAQRRQLQLIGKKMRDMDPDAVREAIARATGESRAAVALLHRRTQRHRHPSSARARALCAPRTRSGEAPEERPGTLSAPSRLS